ncbi:MAG TPA: phenylalanine--tRNA ligase beta subunit-related protein [Polyangia bacterium]|nr:phenylalanine--tRNA ligase beta subunit-related protein [Polyangia bacterium]
MRVEISAGLIPVLRLGVLRLEGMRLPGDNGDALWRELETAAAKLGQDHAGRTPGEIPEVQETRRLYRAVGIDPTKTRPSSEALLRRAIQGKGLYRVHPLVDLFNLASLVSQLSVGLYDESRIEGDLVIVRRGDEGWGFEGIRRGRINVGGRLCLADEAGPFGSPTADSARTSVEGEVPRALAVFFQPRIGDLARIDGALDHAADLADRHLGARVAGRRIVEG